jgi:hypothetical protein
MSTKKEIEMEPKITLEFTLPEVNGILQALSQLPFAQVAQLIQNIQTQAQPQVKTNGASGVEAVVQ